MSSSRSFVPFEDLWHMPIDVPYSFLVRDGHMAWSCGQLALDDEAKVIAAGDLPAQSRVVSDYVGDVLARGGLGDERACRLLLYYIHRDESERDRMLDIFRRRFGSRVLIDAVPVPHYYYDGVMLEVDVFCDEVACDVFQEEQAGVSIRGLATASNTWVSVSCEVDASATLVPALAAALAKRRRSAADLLCEHWFAPSPVLPEFARLLATAGFAPDVGALIDAGRTDGRACGLLLLANDERGHVTQEFEEDGQIAVLMRASHELVWLRARSSRKDFDLVAQTRATMAAIAHKLEASGLSVSDVVKSTTHYVGSSTSEALHSNMRIRNSYYRKPGPASTGLPVFGVSDPSSLVVIDLTLRP